MVQLKRFLIDPKCVFAEAPGMAFQQTRDRHTVEGSVSVVNTHRGKAISVPGGGANHVVGSALPDMGDTFSMLMGFSTNSLSAIQAIGTLGNHADANGGAEIRLGTNGKFRLGKTGVSTYDESAAVIAIDTFYDLAITVNAGSYQYYVNGIPDTSGAGATGFVHGDLVMGSNGDVYFLNGIFQYMIVYSRVVSEQETLDISRDGVLIPPPE